MTDKSDDTDPKLKTGGLSPSTLLGHQWSPPTSYDVIRADHQNTSEPLYCYWMRQKVSGILTRTTLKYSA